MPEHAGDPPLVSPATFVLAGRKRRQPTGGWGSHGPDNIDEQANLRERGRKTVDTRAQGEAEIGQHAQGQPPSRPTASAAASLPTLSPVNGTVANGAGGEASGHVDAPGAGGGDDCDVDNRDTAAAAASLIEVGLCGEGEGGCGGAVSLRSATEVGLDAPIEVEEGIEPVSCLGDFKFTFAEVKKMSKRYPTLNSLGAETAVPLLGWLTRELDMSLVDMRSLILRHPRLMAYRVTSHVAPKTKWLRERLGLGQAQLRKLVTTYPAVLSRSVEENLEPKFKWLEERLGASQEEVQVLIKRFPLIFGYSTTQNLEPTVAFFTDEMSGGQEEVKAAVMSCPSILSRSLDKRIVPRAQQMRAKDIEPRFGPHKWVVSTYTDAQFTRWLGGRGN